MATATNNGCYQPKDHMEKYTVLVDGVVNAIASITDIDNENYDDFYSAVGGMGEVLALAAKSDPNFEQEKECSLMVDAIASSIKELLDCVDDDDSTYSRGLIVKDLSKTLGEVAKTNKIPQALLMPGKEG